MKLLTNETYYSIIESCGLLALESLKLKDLYPTNNQKPIWNVGTLRIERGDGIATQQDNELFRKSYIKDNLETLFLVELERCSKRFILKHKITRSYFYKKCYESLLIKFKESEYWHKPDFGFNIDIEPCVLTFIWSMRHHIENLSKTEESKNVVDNYKPSYIQYNFNNIINKLNEDGTINKIYFGDYFNSWLKQKDKLLFESKNIEIDLKNDSELFNKRLYLIMNNILILYKVVNDFEKSNHTSYFTKIHIQENQIYSSISSLNKIIEIIKIYELEKKYLLAFAFQKYCLLTFDNAIFNLKDFFGIDIYKSPLKQYFEKFKQNLQNSINIEEVKLFVELNKNNEAETSVKVEVQKNENENKVKDLTIQKWFKTGIALATGEAFEIYRKLGANYPTEICRKINVPTSNKTYVSATLADKDNVKNLFNEPKKLKALHKELTEKNLNFGAEFLVKYNQIEPD